MNAPATLSASSASAARIEVAGCAAMCDARGALFLMAEGVLVVSDLHLEKGSSLARSGMLAPPYDTAATLNRLARVIADYQPDVVVSLGDSFHDRGGATRLPAIYRAAIQEMAAGREWYWVAGNHDPDPPAGLPGRAVQELSIGGLTLRHEPTRVAGGGEIAGHLHPGARIVRRGRSVRRPCFASDGSRLVMPAFGAYTGTLNVLDRAYAGLFGAERMTAYLLGRSGVYPVPGAMLAAG